MAYLNEEEKRVLEEFRAKGMKKAAAYKKVGAIVALVGLAALIALFVLLGVGILSEDLFTPLVMIVIAVFVVALVFYFYGRSFMADYQKKVYAFLEERRGKALFGKIVYQANRGIDERVIDYAGFFDVPSRYLGSFYLAGLYEGVPFEKGHYVLQRKETDKNGTRYVTYAEGTFYRFALSRDLGCLVRIVERKQKGGSVDPGNLSIVPTESIAFDEKFAVLSDNPGKALYVLTPTVMEKIMDLEKHFSGLFDLAFIGKEFYVSISDGTAAFSKLPVGHELRDEDLEEAERRIALPATLIEAFKIDEAKFSSAPK